MKWWEISRPCDLHTNSPWCHLGASCRQRHRGVEMASCSQPPACAAILSLPSNTAAQLVPIHYSASSWQASLRAGASLSSMSKVKTMEGILKGFHLFCAFCRLSESWLSRRPSTFSATQATALPTTGKSQWKWSLWSMLAVKRNSEDWWDIAPRSCSHCIYHHYFKERGFFL